MWKQLHANARGCLVFEPLFIVPYSMLTTYASVYMLEMGLSEARIGMIASLGLLLQIFTSFLSGFLTDRMGRRRALLIYDVISWSLAALVWAVSQSFWLFALAALLNSFQRVPTTAWYCLLVEDTPPERRSFIFLVLQLINVVGGLFAPLGGLLVSRFDVVPAMRIMYVLFMVSVTIMFFARNAYTYDTEISVKKQEEGALQGLKETLGDYLGVLKVLATNKPLLIMFAVYILFNFQMVLKGTYHSVYLVDALHIRDSLISLFPAVSSAAMLLYLYGVAPRLKAHLGNRYMGIGFGISAAAYLILLFLPAGSIAGVTVSSAVLAVGTILATPYLEAEVQNAIGDADRAKVFSILSVLILTFTFPAGFIGGWTYMLNPRIPLVLIIVSFAASIVLLGVYKAMSRKKPPAADPDLQA